MKLPRTKLTILSIRHKLSYQLLSLTRHYCNMIVEIAKIGYVVARIDLTGPPSFDFHTNDKGIGYFGAVSQYSRV